MVISGGEYLEWPSDAHYMEDTMEANDIVPRNWIRHEDPEYEDWLWEQMLEDGPPQSDGLTWVKRRAWSIGFSEGKGKLSFDAGEAQIQAL